MQFVRFLKTASCVAAAALVVATLQISPARADTAPPDPTDPKTPVTVAADPLPTVQIDGVAWTQRVIGNTVYVGGKFTTARPAGAAAGVNTTARANLLAYDITTGNLISSWAPTTNGDVLSIVPSPDNSILYIGGSFTTMNGQIRNRIAAINRATGALVTTFQPKPDATVRAIVATNSTVYFGGLLSSVGGTARTRVAAVRASDGALLSWAPNAQGGSVHSLALSPTGDRLIIGGSFTTMNGSGNPGYGLAAVDPLTGTSLPFPAAGLVRDAGANSAITTLSSDGDSLYASGFVFGAGGNLEGIARINWADLTVVWIEDCHGDTYSTYPKGDVIYASSHAHYCGNLPDGFPQTSPTWTQHYGTAFTKAQTGTLTADPLGYYNWAGNPSPSLLKWFPLLLNGTYTGQGQAGWSVAGNADYVTYGGEFPKAGNVPQQGLVRYATRAIAPNKVGPEFNQSKFNPTLTSLAAGTARVSWTANWDRDNEQLTYQVFRNGDLTKPVYQTTQLSSEWNRPSMGFIDTGLVPGQTYRYRVFAHDPLGNEVRSDSVDVVVSNSGAPSAYAQDVKNDGAANYWRLGESSGSAVYDWAGFTDQTAQSGVTRGAAGAIAGDTNTASTFDGSTSGYSAGTSPQTAPDTFTAEAWIKTTSTSGGKVLGYGDAPTGLSGNYDRHVYMTNDGHLIFGVYPGGVRTLTSTKSYNDGQWHQVVAQLGSSGMSLFVDGIRVGTRGDVTSGQPFKGVWKVGGDNIGGWPSQPSSNYFAGAIDDVSIYPTVLTTAQVQQHYVDSGRTVQGPTAPADAYGKAVYQSDPDLFWRLNEASGTAALDASVHQADGTYNGGYTQGGDSGVGLAGDHSVALNGVDGAVASNATYSNPTIYSEELWFKTATQSGGKLIGFGTNQFGSSGGYDRHVYMLDDGRLRFGTYTGQLNVIDSTQSYNDNKWHYLVAAQGPSGMTLSVDDVSVGSNPQTAAQNYDGYWRIGGDNTWGGNTSNYFAGSIDEVAIYPKVLSAAEVQDHFLKGGGTLPNVKPTAAFTSTVSQLSVAFDGSGSSDSDGTVASYSWDFGDGTSGSGKSPTHVYGSAGDKVVVLTVTDNSGATDTATHTVTTVAPSGPLATDAFGRTQSSGWGTADKGGAWTTTGTASLFSVASGQGKIRLTTAGAGPRVALNSVSSTNTDVTVAVALDKVADGGGSFVSVGARTIGNDDYRAKVKVASNGALTLYLTKVVANAETTLTSVTLPSSLNYTAGTTLRIRVQATGTTPTTVRARVWKSTSTEPSTWQLTTTDSSASLQAPGGVGVATYLSTTSTNQPVVVSFDDFSAVTAN